MSATKGAGARRYTSGEVSELTGASYRQVDYWERRGMLGPRQGKASGKPGSGWRRGFTFPELVLARAYVLAAEVAQVRWLERVPIDDIWAPLLEAYEADETLEHIRLVVENERAFIGRETRASAALVVNLCIAAREVRRKEINLKWRTEPGGRYGDLEDGDE